MYQTPPYRAPAPVLRQAQLAFAIVLLIFCALLTSGWLLLQTSSLGAMRSRMMLNWAAICAFGLPLLPVAFLILWLLLRVVYWQDDSHPND